MHLSYEGPYVKDSKIRQKDWSKYHNVANRKGTHGTLQNITTTEL